MRLLIAMVLLGLASAPANAQCYRATITSPTPFLGNNNEVFQLDDGTIWRVKFEYEYLYEYTPDVVICPPEGKLIIKGKDLDVQPVAGQPSQSTNRLQSPPRIVESKIDGEFEGFESDRIFVLQNGQVWQQVNARYKYTYKYAPRVRIYPVSGGFEMSVDGVDGVVRVRRLS